MSPNYQSIINGYFQNVAAARARVYEQIDRIQFQGRRYRRDIAAREEVLEGASGWPRSVL